MGPQFLEFTRIPSPSAIPRRMAIRHTPSRSETARRTRTFIWSRLSCILGTQSRTRLRSPCPVPAFAAYTASGGRRSPSAIRSYATVESIHNCWDRSSYADPALAPVAACPPAESRIPAPPELHAEQSSRRPCSPSSPMPPCAVSAIGPTGSIPVSSPSVCHFPNPSLGRGSTHPVTLAPQIVPSTICIFPF
jgi:hypothetical protein